jgi:hypothetical protein
MYVDDSTIINSPYMNDPMFNNPVLRDFVVRYPFKQIVAIPDAMPGELLVYECLFVDHLAQYGGIPEIEAFLSSRSQDRDARDGIVAGILIFKRLDLISDFIDTFGPLVVPFFEKPHLCGDLDGSEEEFEKTREVIFLLHEKGVDLSRWLELAEGYIAAWEPSNYRPKKEDLMNIPSTPYPPS